MYPPLKSTQSFPPERAFVLKLRREAESADGELRGRIVHLTSDQHIDFAGDSDLLAALRNLLVGIKPQATVRTATDPDARFPQVP